MRLSQSESVALHLKSIRPIMPAGRFHVDGYVEAGYLFTYDGQSELNG